MALSVWAGVVQSNRLNNNCKQAQCQRHHRLRQNWLEGGAPIACVLQPQLPQPQCLNPCAYLESKGPVCASGCQLVGYENTLQDTTADFRVVPDM